MRSSAQRTTLRASLGVALAATLTLTACSAGDPDPGAGEGNGSSDEQVTIRFTWWGNETRDAITNEAVQAFMDENPNITVVTEPTAFDGYFDRLATVTAAGDSPDVITLGGAYPLEYAARGALVDLTTVDAIDMDAFDQSILGNATYDGGVYGAPTGGNTVALLANPRLFEEAGVPLPDDDTWTWDDFADIAAEISANGGDEVFGFEPRFHDFNRVWFAQRGYTMYTEDGGLDVDPAVLEEYWDYALGLRDSGAIPSAELISEVIQASPELTLMGQGRAAMHSAYTNQVGVFSDASGDELILLQFPGETTNERPGMTLLPSQYFSVSSQSDHPEAAAALIDFLLNQPAGASIMGTDRGLTSNPEIREVISGDLNEFQQLEADFLTRVGANGAEGLPPQPAGAGIQNDLTIRLDSEVLFNRLTPAEAAQQWVDELSAELAG